MDQNKHVSKRKHQGTGGVGKEVVLSLVERKGKVRSHHISAEKNMSPHGVIVKFAGRELTEEKFPSVHQHGAIDGTVTGIRGKDETIHITLNSEGRQVSGCETNRTIAKQLGAKLYEPVRLFGRGRWSRDADGVWILEYFKIESFECLEDVPLMTALAALRSIPTKWDDNAYSELDAMRHGKGKRNGGRMGRNK